MAETGREYTPCIRGAQPVAVACVKYTLALAAPMRKDLADIVCCPVHKTPLDLKVRKKDDAGDILEGTLRCAKCDFDYPIEDGIPNLLPPSYHVDEVREAAPKKGNAKPGKPKGRAA